MADDLTTTDETTTDETTVSETTVSETTPPTDPLVATVDRRAGVDRRRTPAAEAAAYTGLERRRGPGRRRADDRRSAEEGEMSPEQFEFVMAVEAYKRVNRRLYPTWTEVLEVLNQLGYRKVQRRTIKLENVPEPEPAKRAA